MTRCVLDGSAALAWILPRESTAALERLYAEVVRQGAVVPALWVAEVANALLVSERGGRIRAVDRTKGLLLLSDLAIRIETAVPDRAWHDVYNLAASHRLTVYDASYLEAALRLSLPLATLDRDLARAAMNSGVAVLGG